MLADLRDSGNVEQDAFNVVFLWANEATDDWRYVYAAKNRNGATMEDKVTFLKEFGFFANYEKDQTTEENV
jgi:replicative DNA helicase